MIVAYIPFQANSDVVSRIHTISRNLPGSMRQRALRADKSPKAMAFNAAFCCSDINCSSPTHSNRNTTTQTANLDRNAPSSSMDERVPNGAQQVGDDASTRSASTLEMLQGGPSVCGHCPSTDDSPYSRMAPSSLMSLIDQPPLNSPLMSFGQQSGMSMAPSSLMSSGSRGSDRLQPSQKAGQAFKEVFSPPPGPKFPARGDGSPIGGTSPSAVEQAIQEERKKGDAISQLRAAAEQRAAAAGVQVTLMAGEGAHMVCPLMANTWLSPRGSGGRSRSVLELTRAQDGPTLEEREEKGQVLTTVDIDTECEVLAALVAAETQDSDDTRPTSEQHPDHLDEEDFEEIAVDADGDATSPEGRQPDQTKREGTQDGATSSSGAASHPSASASKGTVAESPADIAERLDAARVAGHDKLVKCWKESGNMPRDVFQTKHWDELQGTCLSGWACNCRLAMNRGQVSCLRQFSPEQMISFYKETVGPEPGKRSVNQVALRVHRLLWEMKEPLASDSAQRDKGAKYKIDDWKLDAKTVCRSAWEKAYCVKPWMVRSAYGLVRRGLKPADVESSQEATRLSRLLSKTLDADGKVDNERRGWAITWWKNLLLLMDW